MGSSEVVADESRANERAVRTHTDPADPRVLIPKGLWTVLVFTNPILIMPDFFILPRGREPERRLWM